MLKDGEGIAVRDDEFSSTQVPKPNLIRKLCSRNTQNKNKSFFLPEMDQDRVQTPEALPLLFLIGSTTINGPAKHTAITQSFPDTDKQNPAFFHNSHTH